MDVLMILGLRGGVVFWLVWCLGFLFGYCFLYC